MSANEIFISVDIETAGPIPGEFSMLTIGACDAYRPDRTFECALKPTSQNFDEDALQVTGLSLERLGREGLDPVEAMSSFAEWIHGICEEAATPVFVGFNAPFDWSFVNYYFHRYAGGNPFGFTALDVKALYMGATGSSWSETSSKQIAKKLKPRSSGDHTALHDALYQAELFRAVRSMAAAAR
ncbi:MAG: DNA polymerase III subunit epsilon [Erythrobacter sp.]|nr:DNA polymerase III subunit epsilon [Erythrobacter sp.]